MSAGGVALLAVFLASGCYKGTARSLTPADLAREPGWERVEGVPEIRQVARRDCGAAALAMVLGYWRIPVTRDQIADANPSAPDQGIRAGALRDFARGHGMQAFVIKGELADLVREVERHRPVVVGMMKVHGDRAYPHYEVVVGINRREQRVLTLDPAAGLRVNSREGFSAEWAAAGQVTLIVLPRAAADEEESPSPSSRTRLQPRMCSRRDLRFPQGAWPDRDQKTDPVQYLKSL